jgi:hypothetical protein
VIQVAKRQGGFQNRGLEQSTVREKSLDSASVCQSGREERVKENNAEEEE